MNTHIHTRTHRHPVGLLGTSDQLVAEASATQRTCMHSAGFEPAFPAIKLLQTYVLDLTDTGMALSFNFIGVKIHVPSAGETRMLLFARKDVCLP